MTKVVLTLILILMGQKPTTLNLPMPDLKTCQAEEARFLKLEQPEGKAKVIFKFAGCGVGDPTPGQDVKE